MLGPGEVAKGGKEMKFQCPSCKHHKKKLQIMMVPTHKGNMDWRCWVCNFRGKKLSTLFKHVGASEKQIEILYETISELGVVESKDYKDNLNINKIQLPPEFHPLHIPHNSYSYRNAVSYLMKRRKLTPMDVMKYNIGYCESGEYSDMIIIPSYDEYGNLNYFTGRSFYDSDKEYGKFKNPDISRDIIGFDLFVDWSEPITLLESAFNAITTRRNSIPLYGKQILDRLKLKIIDKQVSDIYICLDPDAMKDALNHAEDFMNADIRVYLVETRDGDANDLGFNKMTEVFRNTKQLTFKDLISKRLKL